MISVERADRAENALDSEGYLFDENGEALTDILTDLMHWAAARDLDFFHHTRVASDHFHEESKMSTETLEALEGSICKWDLICQGVEVNEGVDNCPLCNLYYTGPDRYYTCNGCPVFNKTQEITCGGTPYVACESLGILIPLSAFVSMSNVNEGYAKAVELAEAELVFLLGLLPQGHKWRDQI